MISKEQLLELKHSKFDDVDPYNNNRLQGHIVKQQGKYYGTLLLTHINGMQCKEQIILSAPKMYYPFNRAGKFYFTNVDAVAFEKYDGTCVTGYAYEHRGEIYKTFKTRINAVLRAGARYNFIGMWKEMLEKYPTLTDYISLNRTLVFELYGVRNKHLIIYSLSLDIRILFGVDRKTEKILLPGELGIKELPQAEKRYEIKNTTDFISYYRKIQGETEAVNQKTDEGIIGSEGVMFYVKDSERGWGQYKCKPPTIEDIHRKPGMNKQNVIATVYNAYENFDIPTYEAVKELLLEEFEEREIEFKKEMVLRCIEVVEKDVALRALILKEYDSFGVKLHDNKVKVMRHLAEKFGKEHSAYIFNLLKAL